MLLGSCLDLIHGREKAFRNEQYTKILDEAERTLDQRGASPDSIHGGLLALQSLLNHSEMVSNIPLPVLIRMLTSLSHSS
jgi:hypothetical protein